MSDDPVGDALRAVKHAEAIMRRTAEEIHIPPDEPHDDWRPIHGDPQFAKWHPAVGESHIKYHIYPIRRSNQPTVWRANSHGLYQGMGSLTNRGDNLTFPQYDSEFDPVSIPHYPSGNRNFRTIDEAKSAVERYHAKHYGQPVKHDYDIDSIMGEHDRPAPRSRGLGDDEDYSRIFDAVKRALRYVGSVMGFRVAFTDDKDWKTDEYGGRECRLENGHLLYCTQVNSKPEDGWQWGIYDNNQEDPEKRAYAVMQGGKNWGGFDDPTARLGDHLPTFDHARRQAEQEYQKMFPLGTDTGGHRSRADSGVDYDKLINPQHDLDDEDYGHIFGMHRRMAARADAVSESVRMRIAAELSPPCPDCGQVAGFEPHMVSPRIKACRNCGWTMTDYGVDDLLNETLRGHDREVSDLPETDHPTLGKHGNNSTH